MTIFWKEQKRLPILFCDSTATCKINKQPKSITQMKDQTDDKRSFLGLDSTQTSHLLRKAHQYTNVNIIIHVTNTLCCACHVLYA